MSLTKNPIVPLRTLNERAMGFFLNVWKRIQQRGDSYAPVVGESKTVAVDLGQSHLLVLGLEKKSGKPEISNFRLEPRPVSPEAVSERLRAIFKEESLAPRNVRTALGNQGVVIRILTFPQMKRADFSSAIRYEAEKYIPFKSSEVILDFQILNENIDRGGSRFMEILLVAVKHTEIYQLLRIFQNADVEIKLIDVGAFAVVNFVEFTSPTVNETCLGFLDVGTENTTLGILSHGKPVFIREISFGGADILKLLKRKLGTDAVAATPEYQAILGQGLETLLSEIKLSLAYYSNHIANAEPIRTMLVMGGGSRFITELGVLEQEVKVSVSRTSVISHIDIHSRLDASLVKKNEDLLPVAVGLCLRP